MAVASIFRGTPRINRFPLQRNCCLSGCRPPNLHKYGRPLLAWKIIRSLPSDNKRKRAPRARSASPDYGITFTQERTGLRRKLAWKSVSRDQAPCWRDPSKPHQPTKPFLIIIEPSPLAERNVSDRDVEEILGKRYVFKSFGVNVRIRIEPC